MVHVTMVGMEGAEEDKKMTQSIDVTAHGSTNSQKGQKPTTDIGGRRQPTELRLPGNGVTNSRLDYSIWGIILSLAGRSKKLTIA